MSKARITGWIHSGEHLGQRRIRMDVAAWIELGEPQRVIAEIDGDTISAEVVRDGDDAVWAELYCSARLGRCTVRLPRVTT